MRFQFQYHPTSWGDIFSSSVPKSPHPQPGAVDFSNNTPHPDPLLEGEGERGRIKSFWCFGGFEYNYGILYNLFNI